MFKGVKHFAALRSPSFLFMTKRGYKNDINVDIGIYIIYRMSEKIVCIGHKKYMMATIRMPVEIFDDGSHEIHTDLYSVDFSQPMSEFMLESLKTLDSIQEEPEEQEDEDAAEEDEDEEQKEPTKDTRQIQSVSQDPKPTFEESIARILAEEIKPRCRRQINTSFKVYKKSNRNIRFSRKVVEYVDSNSNT